ncbi:bile acid:sodium symporter family protein [Nocardioides marmotae]|uniref:Bile acid:sodium symporter family protein n=1 Tax=Nocardioides marmotae TaxID=2663857 RepID=A0A6I3J539_9ACTN|nr:bile acid:sodium symporter family protein [Nocardioides marmotae]MCR6030676.1 bile acid:sodium symporter family protein [Gordonia jinghuaiqii]MBC9734141.1 bile acid:sodium symporter family protein [Nocardioides marmotae]MTB85244.1 bile acid:sodium symporter family protein [Nocardioides marmotae]MTB94312.1 bile acid:sodium symporter family protein [Nocardioides marmotae]QKE00584.1 bile acid:sodium symporter family protein [Nocardioides marmotae]
MTALLADVDNVRIAFEEGSLTTLKIVIGAILFGIALDTRLGDFTAALRRPGTIAIGVLAQFLLLPALTFALTLLLDVRGSVALGMILVACCPPGNVSNILTHRAGGDVALSVSMTSVGNVLAIFLMPLNMGFWGGLHPTGQAMLEDIELSVADMLGEIAFVIGVPFALGIAIQRLWPRGAATGHRVIGPLSFLALGAVIAVGVANNWSIFLDYIGIVLLAVLLHDALALLLGYGIARATRLPETSTKAMTFEVGIRNAGLGLLLVFTYFDGLGGMALVAAWWGIWDIIAGLAVAQWWRARSTRTTSELETV